MKKTLIFILVFVTLLSTGCDNGKSNTTDDEVNDTDQSTVDEKADETDDENINDNEPDNTVPDEDNAPKITITCPEEIDEVSGKVICEIYSENQSTVLGPDDSCSGQIESETVYSFIPAESFGPGSCTASVRDTVSDETAKAEIKINEVNNAPVFTSSDFSGFTFYEGSLASREFYFSDEDRPKDEEGDPGYTVCSVRDNTCGVEIEILNEDYKCTVSGTMQEELTDSDCEFKLVLTDGYGEETVETVTAILSEKHETPIWTEEPGSFEVNANSAFSGINGKAADPDLPNENEEDPGYLTCELDSNGCSFDIAISSTRDTDGTVSCQLDFTSNEMETCNIQYNATDGAKSVYSGYVQIKVNPTVEIDCPDTVNEEEELVCVITPNGGTPALATVAESCYGEVVEEEGVWKYKKTFSEFESPKTCVAAVTIGEVTAQESIEVLEINNPPELTLSGACSTPEETSAAEEAAFNCFVSMSDVDRPNQIATDPGFFSCEILDNTCGDWLSFNTGCSGSGTPDEASGGTECSYTVKVTDGYGEETAQTVQMTIDEYNSFPVFTTEPDNHYRLLAGEHFEFTYSAADSDLPNSTDGDPGYLKCGVVNDVAQSSVTSTGEGEGTVTCTVEIDAHSTEECGSGCQITFSIEDGPGKKRNEYSYIYVRKCIFFVKPDGTGTEGRTWDDAFGTIQEAVDKAWNGCDIWVKQGTYTNPLKDGSPVVTMKDGVKIIGGFVGNEAYDHELQSYRFRPENPIVHSVLDGENASYHVVVGAMNKAALDGFIVTGGNAAGASIEQKRGGGMYNKAAFAYFSDHFVSNTIFTDNFAEYGGGAVYNEGFFYDQIYFYNCQFLNNSSGQYGGAVLSENAGHITYLESEFSGNSSNIGGAIAETSSRSNLNKCLLKDNSATAHGGAIVLTDLHTHELETQVFIVNSIIYNNSAGTLGGAVSGGFEQLNINHSTFVNNTDPAIIGTNGNISNSIFWNNEVDSTDLNVTYSFGSGIAGTGNIESLPPGSEMFIDENSDFHLDPTSPAIDGADPASTVTEDIEGNTRPSGDNNDMGAYEHVSIEADYYVDCEVSVSGDGHSWASPFKSFHQATGNLLSAGTGGVIFAKGGTCRYSDIGMGQDNIVLLHDGVKIYGGFSGTETYLRERTDPSASPTILDGEKEAITIINSQNGQNIAVDGFVIKNGYDGGFTGKLGTDSKIANCIFENNRAQYGAAMYINGSAPESSIIINTAFINNQSSRSLYGGAIYFYNLSSSNVKIYNCNFLLNSVTQLNNEGAAININSTSNNADIRNSVFYLNRSKYNYAVDPIKGIDEVTLTDSIVDTDPVFVNAPENFAVTYNSGTTSSLYLYGIPDGVTTSNIIEINNDGILRTITSISGSWVNFSPALISPTQEGDTVQFWPAGTTSADLDMHLTGSSQCVDNGTFVPESIRDYSGKRRDEDFDIGIYEY